MPNHESGAMTRHLQLLSTLLHAMGSLFSRIAAVLAGRDAVIADLREQLAAALADDAADDQAVAEAQAGAAAARAEAEAAAARVEELQAMADADAAEDAQISELLAAYEPQPEPWRGWFRRGR
jgi:hypothetical protein